MPDLWLISPNSSALSAKERVRALASRQFGVVARRQLTHLGIPGSRIAYWIRTGELHRLHPGVYAVGHTALGPDGWLTAALLYAGPGAMLSHGTAAWWLGLTGRRPGETHLTTARRCRGRPGLTVHDRRELERWWYRELPVAPVAEVLVGYAATAAADDLRYALARAEYQGWLDLEAVRARLGRGHEGSAALRQALARHEPQLAFTRSELERRLLGVCEDHGLAVPEFNVYVEGYLVDALWRAQRVVVEVDGRRAHSGWGQLQADRERDLALRAAGFIVLRYTWRQLTRRPSAVARDIEAALLSCPGPWAGPGSR